MHQAGILNMQVFLQCPKLLFIHDGKLIGATRYQTTSESENQKANICESKYIFNLDKMEVVWRLLGGKGGYLGGWEGLGQVFPH